MDLLKGFTGSPSRDGIFGSVIKSVLGRESFAIRKEIGREAIGAGREVIDRGADAVRGVAHGVSDELLGTGRRQQTPNTVDALRTRAPGDRVNGATRNLLNQYGPQREAPETPGFLATIGAAFKGLFPESQPQHQVAIVDKSTYSAELIAQKKAAGIDTRNLKQTPEDPPVALASAPAKPADGNPIAAPSMEARTISMPASLPESDGIRSSKGGYDPYDLLKRSKEPSTPLPGANKAGRWDDVLSRSTVSTPVDLTTSFKVAGSPVAIEAAPAIPAAAEFHSKLGDDVYARAQAFVAQSAPKPGGPS